MPEPSTPQRLRIIVAHGEHRSLWHLVDAGTPEEEQPCILGTFPSRQEAEQAREIEEQRNQRKESR